MKLAKIVLLATGLALLGSQPVLAQLGDGLSGKKLTRAIEAAQAHLFGSDQNPVRAQGPAGERAYLRRLRCADGKAPAFERQGSVGIGPYGNILDIYAVQCADAAAQSVYIDMYHGHVEQAPVPGFTVVAP
ncbi:MAG: hypothetical protein EOP58_06405 [Sphingomonadales bacterium]|nr:MAG: hypothetical protein EOP58_06405 [Sphingomonadales bacterium]